MNLLLSVDVRSTQHQRSASVSSSLQQQLGQHSATVSSSSCVLLSSAVVVSIQQQLAAVISISIIRSVSSSQPLFNMVNTLIRGKAKIYICLKKKHLTQQSAKQKLMPNLFLVIKPACVCQPFSGESALVRN